MDLKFPSEMIYGNLKEKCYTFKIEFSQNYPVQQSVIF
jgi:hypothetical protein